MKFSVLVLPRESMFPVIKTSWFKHQNWAVPGIFCHLLNEAWITSGADKILQKKQGKKKTTHTHSHCPGQKMWTLKRLIHLIPKLRKFICCYYCMHSCERKDSWILLQRFTLIQQSTEINILNIFCEQLRLLFQWTRCDAVQQVPHKLIGPPVSLVCYIK